MVDAWSDHRGLQDRSQWVVIHLKDNKDMQINHIQHKIHLQDTDNGRVVHLRADFKKGTGWLEDIFTDVSSVEHNRIYNPHAAGTLGKIYHYEKPEDRTPGQ